MTISSFPFTTQLPGEYNKYNCLAAIAVCKQIGIKDEDIRKGLKSFTGVKGRFEKIANKRGIDIIIDFAHTPNALKQVLSTVKPMVKGRLIHVFGAAGLRDVSKRSFMGTESAKFADLIVLTEEDCRTEDVNQIIDQIALGCINQGAKELQVRQIGQKFESPVFFRIPGRLQAINFAINKLAKKGDTVILTGKAHEKSLCRGKVEYPWSEHEAVKQAISY